MIDDRKKVYITVPNRQWIHAAVCSKLNILIQDPRYKVNIEYPNARPYENNLNQIINVFMKSEYDFWLSIDADNPPYGNPLDLVEWNKDIIGLPTPIWYEAENKGENPVWWSGYDYIEKLDAYREHKPRAGLQRVDAIGTGCFLIARRVFEIDDMRKGSFLRQWLEDGTAYKGNDVSFCERAKRNGFEIYCHYDYPCDHFQTLSLTQVVASFRNMYEQD